jgi:hypothetical protein
LDACKEIALKVNAEKTKYIFVSRHKNAGQNRNLMIPNKSFENLEKLEYLVITVTSQNYIHEVQIQFGGCLEPLKYKLK